MLARKPEVFVPILLFFGAPALFLAANIRQFDQFVYQQFYSPDDWYFVDGDIVVTDELTVIRQFDERLTEVGELHVCIRTEIRKPFQAQWTATIRELGFDGQERPISNGTYTLPVPFEYNIKPLAGFCLNLEEYTGLPVPENPGFYRLYLSWPMVDDRGRRQTQRATSNLFEIL